jgi:tRNA nucleotidyltransferase (CCA-adding enzyme)
VFHIGVGERELFLLVENSPEKLWGISKFIKVVEIIVALNTFSLHCIRIKIMRIILTHEQADFDALASLLGAFLLDETAVPILPRRMNRNVNAYITIYGADLPFVEARDLPNEPVDLVTLVDTQSMVSVRGVGGLTHVNVVDHHPLRGDLPADWQMLVEQVGATTTILVEAMQERNETLLPSHATLLLLGIYEDTGSLTFSRTTPRDLQAAAYLLDQGANLRIASDFLNHPLSAGQQEIYELLRKSAEVHDIHGHLVVVASGDARQIDEELSTLAHKLNDLLDPEALFLLVETRSGVQLIARSTSDHIDVAAITSRFGGGGHDRAAAALIRDRELPKAKSDLMACLAELIRPAMTVSQIMSRGPQVLTPETPANEAADRMQRFGYEGYPVVKDDQVVGLLTRRDVDRALSHKLNKTAASLMNAGSFTVKPDDSIEKLQRLMVESGWGQIPVVHPEHGYIIGIVTRTDLLKALAVRKEVFPGKQNLSSKLEKALPPSRLALLQAVVGVANGLHLPTYIVGGFVRDLLLDRPGLDFDIVVEGDAISLVDSLVRKFGGTVKTHGRFGTAKWYLKGSHVFQQYQAAKRSNPPGGSVILTNDLPEFLDLISARTEFYTYPTALPTVERGSIKLDLHRRDFTINTLCLRLDGNHYGDLYDYWGGMNDLSRGLVRVLHSLSFVDDPTRMLRAVRFEQRFGFQIETRTLQLLSEALSLITRVSGDRIHHELDHILDELKSGPMIHRLEELGLLKAIHPGLKVDAWFQNQLSLMPLVKPADHWLFNAHEWGNIPWNEFRRMVIYGLWLVRLDPTQIKSVCDRLKHPSEGSGDILAANKLISLLDDICTLKPGQATEILDEYPLRSIVISYLAVGDNNSRQLLNEYFVRFRFVHPNMNGNDLRANGLPPGPVYRQILTRLRAAWLDGDIHTVEQEKELFEQLIREALGPG